MIFKPVFNRYSTLPMRLISLLFILMLSTFAQNNTEASESNEPEDSVIQRAFWKANLPGGNYMVSLSSITSVSNHRYLLDGVVVVSEVTIDTTGDSIVRFYQLTPLDEYSALGVTSLLSEAIEQMAEISEDYVDLDITSLVHKKHPVTTHAKTVEYQIKTLPQLSALFKSATKAWENNRGRSFTIK